MYAKHPVVQGWRFEYEYPGFFQLSHGEYSFCFTPDWDTKGEVCIQVFKEEGAFYVDGWDIPYVNPLDADQLVKLIEPKLIEIKERVKHGQV